GLFKEGLTALGYPERADIVYIFFEELIDQRLSDDGFPEVGVFAASFCKNFQAEMAIAFYVFIFDTAYYVYQVVEAKAFIGLFHSLQCDLNIVCTVETFSRVHTVVAHAAVILRVFFSKVMQ